MTRWARKMPCPPFSGQGCRPQCTSFHWWSGELTENYFAMQVALDFNTGPFWPCNFPSLAFE